MSEPKAERGVGGVPPSEPAVSWFEEIAVVETRRRWLWSLQRAHLYAFAALWLAACGPGHPSGRTLLAILVGWILWGAFHGFIEMAGGALVARRGRAVADAQGLSLDGVRVLARKRIRVGYTHVDLRGVRRVRLWPERGLHVDVLVSSEERGRALLRALNLEAGRTRSTFAAKKTFARAMVALLALVLTMQVLLLTLEKAGLGSLAAWVPSLQFLLWWLLPDREWVTVGAEGIALRPVLGRNRYVRFEDITSVQRKRSVVVLELRRARGLRINSEDDAALAEHIENAVAHYRAQRGTSDAAPANALDRGRRSAREWVRALRAAGKGGYRAAALKRDDAWRILEDPGASPATRAGAAVALGAPRDAAEHARLRVAADACAEPKLRVAIDTATRADAEDDALEEALGMLGDAPG